MVDPLRIQHLLVSKEKQEQLVAELKALNPAQVELLGKLLDEHDEACLNVLDEKVKEQATVHTDLMKDMQGNAPQQTVDPMQLRAYITALFSDPTKLAEFFAQASDQVIEALQTIIVGAAEGEQQARFKSFFQQMRLMRASLDKQDKDAYKQALIDDIQKKQAAIAEMDALIKEGEEACLPSSGG